MRVREPAFAGQFYDADPGELRERIEWCFKHQIGPGRVPEVSRVRKPSSIGYVVPHAGYVYSGPVAAHTYYWIAGEGRPETFILIGPNHTGLGASVAVWPDGAWRTPLGSIGIDEELASEILKSSRFARPDTSAHEQEHSLEVQLPFLQYLFREGFRIVPIAMLYQTPETAKDLSSSIVKAIKALGRDAVLIASSDMTHYEPHELAIRKDELALKRIVDLDPEGLYSTVIEREISMCGVGPVMTLIYVAKELGYGRAEVLKHATSGDVTGEKAWVVGYASLRIHK